MISTDSYTHHTMKFAPLVTLRPAIHFMLTRAELAEILGRLGHRVGEKVHFDPT